jgi:hypothetical protein
MQPFQLTLACLLMMPVSLTILAIQRLYESQNHTLATLVTEGPDKTRQDGSRLVPWLLVSVVLPLAGQNQCVATVHA